MVGQKTRQRWRAASLFFCALLMVLGDGAAPDHHPASRREDVEVMRGGGTIMYRYRDADGRTVVVDTPPPFYFDVDDDASAPSESAPVAESNVALPETKPAPVPAAPQRPAWWPFAWLLPAVLLLAGLVIALRPWLHRLRHETPLDRVIRKSGLPVFEELKLTPDGRNIVLADRVLRTSSGMLVVIATTLNGDVRGGLDADHWVVGNKTLLNPLKRLAQASAAVAHYALDVPVHGRLVVRGAPKFAMPLPSTAQSVATFAKELPEFIEPELPARKLDAVWRTLMRQPHSNAQVTRRGGPGLLGALRRNTRLIGAGMLVLAAVIASVALLGVAPVS